MNFGPLSSCRRRIERPSISAVFAFVVLSLLCACSTDPTVQLAPTITPVASTQASPHMDLLEIVDTHLEDQGGVLYNLDVLLLIESMNTTPSAETVARLAAYASQAPLPEFSQSHDV